MLMMEPLGRLRVGDEEDSAGLSQSHRIPPTRSTGREKTEGGQAGKGLSQNQPKPFPPLPPARTRTRAAFTQLSPAHTCASWKLEGGGGGAFKGWSQGEGSGSFSFPSNLHNAGDQVGARLGVCV